MNPVLKPLQPAALTPGVPYSSMSVRALVAGERRLDSETYLTGGYGIRLQIETSSDYTPMSELADIWQPNRLKGIGVASDQGVPFLTATQVFDIRPLARKWLAPNRTPHLARRLVEPGWILVTRSGSVGDTIVSYSPHLSLIVSDDLLRVQVRDPKYFGYLYAFLRTRFGRTMLRASRYGSIIKHLEPEHLFDIPVPNIPDELCTSLNDSVRKVFTLREEAYSRVLAAEDLFAQQLGNPRAINDGNTTYTIRSSSMFSGRRRLDSYYYNRIAEDTSRSIVSTGKRCDLLANVTKRVFGVGRFKHVYSDHGIPYLDSEDLFKVNPELAKFIPEVTKKDASSYYVERNWLLMACSGQIYGLNGSVVLADTWHENKIVSNHVIRIIPRDGNDGIRPGYLQMVLGHPSLGRPLVCRLAFGSEVPEIASGDLAEFPVVRLDYGIEAEIAEHVEQASHLRMQADNEENATAKFVEEYLETLLDTHIADLRATSEN